MNFFDAIKTCFSKYVTFSGRASRSEFWYFYLFSIILNIILFIVSDIFMWVSALLLILPLLAVTARRLHDINKSGWWQLIGFVPIIGWVMIFFYIKKSDLEDNKYGSIPS